MTALQWKWTKRNNGANLPKAVDVVLGGWNLNGIGDVGIGRNIFRIRTELFNAFNDPNFRAAMQTFTSTTFGTTCCSMRSTASSASTLSGESWRVVQFAMKLGF